MPAVLRNAIHPRHVRILDKGRVEIAVACVAVAGYRDAEFRRDMIEFRNDVGN